MEMSDYAQLRRRAEQCRAEELARLLALLKQMLSKWRARWSGLPGLGLAARVPLRPEGAAAGLPNADSAQPWQDLP
jgi:hypothetical protein